MGVPPMRTGNGFCAYCLFHGRDAHATVRYDRIYICTFHGRDAHATGLHYHLTVSANTTAPMVNSAPMMR